MSDSNTIVPKVDRTVLAERRRRAPQDLKQWKLMAGSLCLLLLALGIVLWRNSDFWFPASQEDAQEAESDQPVESSPANKIAPVQVPSTNAKHAVAAKSKNHAAAAAPKTPDVPSPPPPPVVTTRSVLPPLEVEVVAGDKRRTIRPGSSSVRVDLQPGAPSQSVTEPAVATPAVAGPAVTEPAVTADRETAAKVTHEAAEHVQMSANASEVVSSPVRPNYPMLARQMKVQGSVIMQALIGKDGVIQNLRVVSGPHILASAAQDAVRQWHFKPHFEGSEAVETQAKITVNFTISTN
ncbi:MAG: TonB family protein [Candidatus Sulfotelmatobacter sp.]|jgi:protein TonB